MVAISKRFPIIAPLAIGLKTRLRSTKLLQPKYNLSVDERYAHHLVYKSQSILKRTLGNADPKLQDAKVVNLKIAVLLFNNLCIKPNKVFSFWKVLGEPTYTRGFVDGMLLSDGEILTGVGGGLCQMANMIHWLMLHTPLTLKEHFHHDFDIFPDSGRQIPFGSGASVYYNYFDLQYKNTTKETFTVKVNLTDKYLKGEIWSDTTQDYSYKIVEEDHSFYRENNENSQIYRTNKLFKTVIDKKTGEIISKTLFKKNVAKVLYKMDDFL